MASNTENKRQIRNEFRSVKTFSEKMSAIYFPFFYFKLWHEQRL